MAPGCFSINQQKQDDQIELISNHVTSSKNSIPLPLDEYPYSSQEEQNNINMEHKHKVKQFEAKNNEKKNTTKTNRRISRSLPMDTIDSFEILEQTIMKQKKLAKLKNTDLRKKILLKRTFDLVCEIMDHENGVDEESDKITTSIDEDEEEIEQDEVKLNDSSSDEESDDSSSDSSSESDSDESSSSDEEEEDDDDEARDDNQEDSDDQEETELKKLLKIYEKEMTNDQLIPTIHLNTPAAAAATAAITTTTRTIEPREFDLVAAALVVEKDLLFDNADNDDSNGLDDSMGNNEIYLNILSDDDLAEFNFDSGLYIPYDEINNNNNSSINDQATNLNQLEDTKSASEKLNSEKQDQVIDSGIKEMPLLSINIQSTNKIITSQSSSSSNFKRSSNCNNKKKMKWRLSNSDEEEDDEDDDDDDDDEYEENEYHHDLLDYNDDQQIITFTLKSQPNNCCFVYSNGSTDNNKSLKRKFNSCFKSTSTEPNETTTICNMNVNQDDFEYKTNSNCNKKFKTS